MLVWRDEVDGNAYHVGTSTTWWFTLYDDGVAEVFGDAIYLKIANANFDDGPVEIKLYTESDITEAIQQEREECALIADNWGSAGEQVAEEIRSRK